MRGSSALRRTAGWASVAIGGVGLVVPIIVIRSQFGRAPGTGNAGTYFETASLLHIPVWIAVGLVLVFVGFSIIPPGDATGSDES